MKPRSAMFVACGILAVAVPISAWLSGFAPSGSGTVELPWTLAEAIPLELDGWRGVDEALTEAERTLTRVDDHVKRRYRGPGGEDVALYVTYHGNRQRGLETFYHNATVCYPADGFEHVDTRPEDVILNRAAREVPTCRYTFVKGGLRLSVRTFFKIDDELIDQSPRNKPLWLVQHKAVPRLDRSPGTFFQVQVITPVQDGDDHRADRLQKRFLNVFGARILSAIDVSGAAP